MYSDFNSQNCFKNLKKNRELSGFTQRMVDEELGLRKMSTFDIERGKQRLTLDLVIKLCTLYDCSIDELIGLKKTKEDSNINTKDLKFLPVFQAGIVKSDYYVIHHHLIADPYIMTELGLNKVIQRKSPFDSLTINLKEDHKKKIIIDTLKYLSSLIGIDGNIAREELAFQKSIMDSLFFELLDKDRSAIRKCISKPYMGKMSKRYFNKKGIKRFLIWMLVVAAYSDNEIVEKEYSYIVRVATNIGLSEEDVKFIKEKVESVL